MKAIAKNVCLKNIEMSLQVLGKQGMPRKYIVEADDIHSMKSVERIWLMLRKIFD